MKKKVSLSFKALIEAVVNEGQIKHPLPNKEQLLQTITEESSYTLREGEVLTVSEVSLVITEAEEEAK